MGRKLSIGLIILIVLAVGAIPVIRSVTTSSDQANESLPSTDPQQTTTINTYDRVLFAGDSITVGRDAQELPKSFRELVEQKLSSGGTNSITTIAKSGAKLKYVAERKELPSKVDLAIVELGTNDIRGRTPAQVFKREYQAYLKKIKASSPKVKLVCLGVWHDSKSKNTQALDRIIRESCLQNGGTYIQISDIFDQPANRGLPAPSLGKGSQTHSIQIIWVIRPSRKGLAANWGCRPNKIWG